MNVSQQKNGRRGGTASSHYAKVKLIETIQPRWRKMNPIVCGLSRSGGCREEKMGTQEAAGNLRVVGS